MRIRRDGLDIEQLEAMADTHGYRLVRDRLGQMRARALAALVTADTWEKTARLQQEVQTLDIVLGLPAALAREIAK